jgi:SHS2 domain-containing protein
MPKFRFLEDVAIADAAFEAYGDTLEELFESCALATFEVMVETRGVKQRRKEKIEVKDPNLEDLLFDFLSELVYLKDTHKIFFSRFDLNITQRKEYVLAGTLWGDKIDYSKQEIRQDVKAVTYHLLEVKKTEDGWKARVILDT